MKRSYLKIDDKSSAGGTVAEGIALTTHQGKEITFIGAMVRCPTCCNSGLIVAEGPRWPDELMGKQVALDGDLCSCKCYPLPVMLASQSDMTMNFESSELASMGFSTNDSALDEKEASEHWIKFALNEKGSCKGLGCRAHFADGSVEYGTFNSENVVHFKRPNSFPCEKVELVTDNQTPSGSLIESLLSSMRD